MAALRPLLAGALAGAVLAASLPAAAQQPGMPGYQPLPYGYTPPPQPYGPPQTQFASPVAMGFGIALAVIGVGGMIGGFAALAVKDQYGQTNVGLSSALLGAGGTLAALGVPLIIYGAREVPVYAPNGYGPQMKLPKWFGQPRLVLGNPKAGTPVGGTWLWTL
jgi:hypothetical protein